LAEIQQNTTLDVPDAMAILFSVINVVILDVSSKVVTITGSFDAEKTISTKTEFTYTLEK
jgi:hypothetical protein